MQGGLPERHSFLELKAENVVLTAAKKAEDAWHIHFLRFYEGREGDDVCCALTREWQARRNGTLIGIDP